MASWSLLCPFASRDQVQLARIHVMADVGGEPLGHRQHQRRGDEPVPAVLSKKQSWIPCPYCSRGCRSVEHHPVNTADLQRHVTGQDLRPAVRGSVITGSGWRLAGNGHPTAASGEMRSRRSRTALGPGRSPRQLQPACAQTPARTGMPRRVGAKPRLFMHHHRPRRHPLLPPTRSSCIAVPRLPARGPSPLAVGLIEESRRRSERKPRQGRPDAAGARGAGSGMAGCRPGACGPRAIRGRETDASAGSSSRPGFRQTAGRPGTSRWTTAGAVPGRPGYRRVRLPGASRPVPALR